MNIFYNKTIQILHAEYLEATNGVFTMQLHVHFPTKFSILLREYTTLKIPLPLLRMQHIPIQNSVLFLLHIQ